MTDSSGLNLAKVERAAVQTSPALRPWMKELAVWHASSAKWPPQAETLTMANRLAGVRIGLNTLKLVLDNPDWLELREEMAVDGLKRERKRLEGLTSEFIDAHIWALRSAVKAKDYRAVSKMSKDVVDRVWPKREEDNTQPVSITINIGSNGSTGQVQVLDPMPCEIVVDEVVVEEGDASREA